MRLPENFIHEWFGFAGRELGRPERFYVDNPKALFKLLEENHRGGSPCYMSVQPYDGPDSPCALEKLFFDFDSETDLSLAWRDASSFAQALKQFYDVEPLIVYSGRRGYHVYVFLSRVVKVGSTPLIFVKQVYQELQLRLLKGLRLQTLDLQVIGDVKRLSRVPFSVHEKTGSLCCPVTLEHKPHVPDCLDGYRTLDVEVLSLVIKELMTRDMLVTLGSSKRGRMTSKAIRPCIEAALNKPLEGCGGHLMRLAIVREFLAAGYTVKEIVPLFQSQPDFNPEKTRYYVEHAQKKPVKPFKCETIRRLGFCLQDCRRRMR